MAELAEVVEAGEDWLEAGVKAAEAVIVPKVAEETPKPAEKKAEAPAPTPEKPTGVPAVETPKPQPEPTAEKPPEPVQPAPEDPTQRYIKELHEDRKNLNKAVETLIAENAKLNESLRRNLAPEKALTADEIEEKKKADRDRLMEDPEGFLAVREKELREKVQKETLEKAQGDLATSLGYKDVNEMETAFAARKGFATLETETNAKGEKKHPLLADAEFRKQMGSKENLDAVFEEFDKTLPSATVVKDPKFWTMAYQRTAMAYLAKAANPAPAGASPAEEPANLTPSPPNATPKTGTPEAILQDEWSQVEKVNTKVL